ncbi:hypothetical protein FAM15407_002298 [Propionibacterium freudenreichii]|uniref:hypothetical protein n=1 Tax=Propionibacterium freudenreichii TaxID=1744 RepID=UPI00255116DF|nr:hypothetical protein [Propionibacterium freudenreichii]MDK9658669.1 hypothetical protein [Propionibacterium freudenreichii]
MPAPDFDVVEFAALLRSLPPHLPISDAFEASQTQGSDSRWSTQRLHMTRWFAAQATLGSGQYTRSEPNRSARTTYQRLQSSYGLIWIAEALGADTAELQATVDEAAAEPDHRRHMGLLRRHLPWDMIAELATTRLAEQRRTRRGPGRLREQSLNAVRKRLRTTRLRRR